MTTQHKTNSKYVLYCLCFALPGYSSQDHQETKTTKKHRKTKDRPHVFSCLIEARQNLKDRKRGQGKRAHDKD
jgi:hypothetical protein